MNSGEDVTGIDIIFPLSTLHQVSAVVQSAGGSLPKGIQVSLVYADNQELLDTASVDPETHTAIFTSVPEGNYLLQVQAGDSSRTPNPALNVPMQVRADLQNVPPEPPVTIHRAIMLTQKNGRRRSNSSSRHLKENSHPQELEWRRDRSSSWQRQC